MELFFDKFDSYEDPQNDMIGHIHSVCNSFSYGFSSGIYFLTGESDCGAWSFTASLLDGARNEGLRCEKIILDGKTVDLSEVRKLSFHVGQFKAYGKRKTFASIVKKALKKSKIDYTFEDICQKFGIDDETLMNRKMFLLSLRIWRFTAAIGLAMDKKIFVFPHLSKCRITDTDFFWLFRVLREEDVIVLVPCSDKIIIPREERFTVVRMNSLFHFDQEHNHEYL